MSSSLFAFQMAKPVATVADEHGTAEYDAQAQTLVWRGGERAHAVYCTTITNVGVYYTSCNAYGDYCSLGGGSDVGPFYQCDN